MRNPDQQAFETARAVAGHAMPGSVLAESGALDHGVLAASADRIELLDAKGHIRFLNPAAVEAAAVIDAAQARGQPWLSLWPDESRQAIAEALAKAVGGSPGRFTAHARSSTGATRWYDVIVAPARDGTGAVDALVAIGRDVTEQRIAEERIRWAADHDHLTGLPNRAFFQSRLAEALVEADRTGGRVAVALLDLDDFKRVNDTVGHDAGDAVLRSVAARLREAVRSTDVVARLGGDEFALLLTRLAPEADYLAPIEAILPILREPLRFAGHLLDCRASVGVTLYPDHHKDADELLKNADMALYAAKAAGKGQFAVYSDDMRRALHARMAVAAQVRDALTENRVVPFYQPKISFATGGIEGFEALLRWRHPTGGIMRPAAISTAFEDRDLAEALTQRMLEQVVADMRRWLDQGIEFGHVAINTVAAEFRRGDFAERVLERLHRAAIPPDRLEIEVTETAFLGTGTDSVQTVLRTLSEAGVSIALDDFGTGYASLSHLKQFPVDVIKIDHSFIQQLESCANDATIVRALINLGHNLGIAVVAEGVETIAQARHLLLNGCDQGQGNFFSRPRSRADIVDLVRSWRPIQLRPAEAG